MPPWYGPHSSAQIIGYLPTLVGVKFNIVGWPGMTSCLRRNSGTQKAWITSFDYIFMLTGCPTGTCSSPEIISPFG